MFVIDPIAEANIQEWLNGPFDEATKEGIKSLIKRNPDDAINAFYRSLSFGTGGMRGLMGVGTNRLNIYTIKMATQGLANYLLKTEKGELSVLIGYDSREGSKEFAEEAAKVLAGNNIKVYLFKNLRPTPLVSYGCRFKKANAAIMITASHNPKEYNGFKVYWNDGAQVLPPHDIGIVEEVEKIKTLAHVKTTPSINSPLIELIEEEVDQNYIKDTLSLQFYEEVNKKKGSDLNIVYTSLHGTGITVTPKLLSQAGFTSIKYVDSQIIPDGKFPTVPFPNPEEKEALTLGIEKLISTNSDILIAQDPDADRIGVVAMHEGKPFIFTGNQVACICLEHILKALEDSGAMLENKGFIKTIVTTELFAEIVKHYGATYTDVLTGFKYIAEVIADWEKANGPKYIFGGEESLGYLLGTFARDKDAVGAAMLIGEVALLAKLEGKTLVDKLYDLYEEYGIYSEKVISVKFSESKAGKEAMIASMKKLRENHFTEIEGFQVIAIDDYLLKTSHDLINGKVTPITLPTSDVLIYRLLGGSKLMIRPSGTEPKVKIYCSVVEEDYEDLESGKKKADKRADELLETVQELLQEAK